MKVRREADGQINLVKLLPRAASAASLFSTTSKAKPWLVTLSSLNLVGCGVAFEDRRISPPNSLVISPIQLTAERLSTDLKNPARLSFRLSWSGSSTLSGSGTVGLRPLSGAMAVDLRNADLAPFAPYRPEWLVALLSDGAANARGDLSFRQDPDGRFTARFSGDASLDGLSLLDPSGQTEIFAWRSLALRGILAQARPGLLEVREAELQEPSVHLIVSPEGKPNLGSVVRFQPRAEQDVQKMKGVGLPPPPFPVKVDSLTVRKGHVRLTNRTVRQALNNRLAELEGRVTAFSSEPGRRAKVEVTGLLGGGAPCASPARWIPSGRTSTRT